MDRDTIAVYDAEGAHYAIRRGIQRPERSRRFGDALPTGGRRLDLGTGPGHHLALLGEPTFALDASWSMAAAAHATGDAAGVVQADLLDLPFGRHAFDGVWASKSLQHVSATELPSALAELHRVTTVGGRLEMTVFAGDGEGVTDEADDDLPGRFFALWSPERLRTVIEAAGFSVEELTVGRGEPPYVDVEARARRALPDHVGAGMRLLCCGLNPSLHAADAGIGYVTGSNRFWKALAAAGLSSRDRDPRHLLRHDHIGMTDLVKRATPRADELTKDEYRVGVERLRALCEWLTPAALAVVGLAGWRAAVDRRAVVGWQPDPLGPTPVYVLPSTSGLNAGTSLDDLVEHLRSAATGPEPA